MQTSIFQLEGRVDTISCVTIYTVYTLQSLAAGGGDLGGGASHIISSCWPPRHRHHCARCRLVLHTIHRFHKPSTGLFRDCTTSPINRQQHYKCSLSVGILAASCVCQPRPSDCQVVIRLFWSLSVGTSRPAIETLAPL